MPLTGHSHFAGAYYSNLWHNKNMKPRGNIKGLKRWTAFLKGKTYEEIFGIERAKKMRQSRSNPNAVYSRKVKHYCLDCGAEIYRGSIRCLKCAKSGENQPMKGKHYPEGVYLKRSIANKGRPMPPGTGAKISKAKMGHIVSPETRKKIATHWQNEEYWLKQMKARQIKPNKEELKLASFLAELELPYRFVGDGQFILGGKCPDFLNVDGQKKLIEYWGEFWHRGQKPDDRINFFRQYGFETLVIRSSELRNKETLSARLISFNQQPVV